MTAQIERCGMDKPLSLLVVDVSEDWEEVLKACERGYGIDWEHFSSRGYVCGKLDPESLLTIQYPHGSVRAGFNAITDTTRIAHQRGVPTYAVHLYNAWSDGQDETCFSLQPYIPQANRYGKGGPSAFKCALAERLASEGCQYLMVIGYDRDDCVLATIKDAVALGITVVTSEHCMLTQNHPWNNRDDSLAYFREHTVFLETLPEVWNYLCNAKK